MGSKKKRKSVPPAEEQPTKRPSSQQGRRSGGSGGGGGGSSSGPLVWSPEGLTASLPANQALVFAGRAQLSVQSGEVLVFGSVVTAASGAIELAADERSGGALLLEPGAAAPGTVPLAASGPAAVLTLTPAAGGSDSSGMPEPKGVQAHAGAEEAGGSVSASEARRRQHGFDAWLSSDPHAPPTPPPLPPLWQQAAGEVEATLLHAVAAQQAQQQLPCGAQLAPPVIVVCGAKKVGKSTFARFLANSLLSRHPCVAYLDTDCGQPEFTPPGLVSLSLLRAPVLGPPHMHQQRPAASFFLGEVSPANDPVRYLQCVRELYCWYCQHGAAAAAAAAPPQEQQQQQQQQPPAPLPPLVVNTHGWVKGMGFDVLAELLQGLPVSHLVQIAASNPKKNLPAGAFWLPDPVDRGSGEGEGDASGASGGQLAPSPPMPLPPQPQVLQWLLPGLGGDQPAQPAVSDTSVRSAATYATAAGSEGAAAAGGGGAGGGVGGRGRVHAVEQRALQWEALAQQCVDACGLPLPASGAAAAAAAPKGGGGGRGAGGGATAPTPAAGSEDLGDRLAAAVPFVVDAVDMELQVLHSSVPPSQLFYALNGAVVGLCSRPPPLPAEQQQQQAAALPPAPPLPRCLGLGIVRAADAARRRLYILTAVPAEELEGVDVLQMGRLELPASLLQTGAHMSPYLALHSLSSAGTGAGAIKSRNNLLRQSQL